MTDFDDLPFPGPDSAANPAAQPKRHRHEWEGIRRFGYPGEATLDEALTMGPAFFRCLRCGAIRDEARARRGRAARARGLRIQRERNRGLGVTNIAGNAPNHDGGTHRDPFVTESKSGGAFSERYWRWLRAIPAEAGQTRVLVVTSADGRGHRARSYVVVEFDDWRDLHGETER